MSKEHRKLGRLPRGHDARIPKMVAVRKDSPPLPTSIDYSIGMPSDLGAMLNDSLGDCTCAAVGHAIQIWTFNADGSSKMVTPPDSDIEALYELAGGYVPGNPSTDNGCVEQTVLTDWLNDAVDGNVLTAYVEVDQTDMDEVKRTICECGLIYIGFNVPNYLMNVPAGGTWDVDPHGDNSSAGGHAVVICGYDVNGNMKVQSWGDWYIMTPAFWAANVDECYALANKDWMETTGNSPAGLTIAELETLMQSMKFTPPSGDRRQHRRKKRQRALTSGESKIEVVSGPCPHGYNPITDCSTCMRERRNAA
jgi:hypothetical protein